jgi:L-lysine 6-transaminase
MHGTIPDTRSSEAKEVLSDLKKHILVDGFEMVVDVSRSDGSRFYDSAGDRSLIDLYSFYASMPIGFNHAYFDQPDVREEMVEASMVKVANSDVYTPYYARFVNAFSRVVGITGMSRYFFIEGGALAVENALKTAMDWKVQKNMAAGRGEIGTDVLHFRQCFHGRSGYTMSLTNTDPTKTKYYAKFDWPRVHNPALDFSLPPRERTEKVVLDEKKAEAEILAAIEARPHRICAIILEPIQCEGGDNHFRGEWFKTLRGLCDKHDMLLIFDEVQTGMCMSGRTWCFQHFDVTPDLVVFGKKAQVCGLIAGNRIDDVPTNVFKVSSRINSTWGGNLMDMVRSTHYLKIIERENLVENARIMGERFIGELQSLQADEPLVTAVRGRGLLMAFSLPSTDARNQFWKGCFDLGLLTLRCGERSIRLRPVLDVKPEIVDEAIAIMRKQLTRMHT